MFKIGDKVVLDEFDFDNYFYVLELNSGETFIASYEDEDDDIWGLGGDDKNNICTCINQDNIKKIIAIIPKR